MNQFSRKNRLHIITMLTVVAIGTIAIKQMFTVEQTVQLIDAFRQRVHEAPVLFGLVICLIQLVGMALCLPTKALFTLVTGALFNPAWGYLITMTGVLGGTSLLFLWTTRLQPKLSDRTERLIAPWRQRLRQYPLRTAAALRLIITLPYGPITIAAALMRLPYRAFMAGSVLGDTPVVILYLLAGQSAIRLSNSAMIVKPGQAILLSAAAAIFLAPLIRDIVVQHYKSRSQQK